MKFTGGPLEGYVSPPEQDAELGEEWTYRGLDAQEHTYRREDDEMRFVESVPAAAPAIAVEPEPAPAHDSADEPTPDPLPEQPDPDDRQASAPPE